VIGDPEAIFEALPQLAAESDFVVVDGPGSLSEVTKSILARCDFALIPSGASRIDIVSMGKLMQYVRHAQELRQGSPVTALYLSKVKKGSVLLREAQEALGKSSIKLLESMIYHRTCIEDAPGQASTVLKMPGATASEAAALFDSLFNEAMRLSNGK
jgi:chromosome partitioning protein